VSLLPEDADAGAGVAALDTAFFEEELLHETASSKNIKPAKQKAFFIKGLRNKFPIVNEPIGRFAILSSLPRLRFVRAETN
jgi:hypothetical protein